MIRVASARVVKHRSNRCHLCRYWKRPGPKKFRDSCGSSARRAGRRMQTALVRWAGEQKFLAMSPSGHAMAMDSDRESNKAPGPMELLLMALGACTATDVVVVLRKKRKKLESLEVIC